MLPDLELSTLLANATNAGVYRLPSWTTQQFESFSRAAGVAGCLLQRVDLKAARDKDDLLAVIGKTLRFPEWFGHNWDALSDCLGDMGWQPAEGYVLILDHCAAICHRAEPEMLILLEVLQSACEEWRERGVPFWCLVDLPEPMAPDLLWADGWP